jgi:hypothetical protein
MTKQEKQLLLIDLCARLPYGVKIHETSSTTKMEPFIPLGIEGTNIIRKDYRCESTNYIGSIGIEMCLPYLRPMSSMTEQERKHLQTLHDIISDENYGDGFSPAAWEAILDFNNYCREHHLDNGGLITLGLALEAPEEMYK